jgi:hypothetical protein
MERDCNEGTGGDACRKKVQVVMLVETCGKSLQTFPDDGSLILATSGQHLTSLKK